MTSPSAAANAYANLARMSEASAGLGKALGESNGPSFGSLLKDARRRGRGRPQAGEREHIESGVLARFRAS